MLNYLIQTLLISGIFIALYKTVIIKSNWFVFNRIYLILTPIIALLVPLITFKETVYVQMNGIAAQTQNFVTPISEEQSTNYLLISLSAIYFSALIVFLFSAFLLQAIHRFYYFVYFQLWNVSQIVFLLQTIPFYHFHPFLLRF